MKELIAGVSDDDLPPETKARMFCKFHQDKLGVTCQNKLYCDRCGWNPAVSARRKKIINERRREFQYDL